MSTSIKEDSGVKSHVRVREDRQSVLVYLAPTLENWGEYAVAKVPDKSVSADETAPASPSVLPGDRKSFWLLPPNEQSDLSNVTYKLVKNDQGVSKKHVEPFYIKDRRT